MLYRHVFHGLLEFLIHFILNFVLLCFEQLHPGRLPQNDGAVLQEVLSVDPVLVESGDVEDGCARVELGAQDFTHFGPFGVLYLETVQGSVKSTIDEAHSVEVLGVYVKLILISSFNKEWEGLFSDLTDVGRSLDQLLTNVATFGC